MSGKKDLTGQRFGRLVAIRDSGKRKGTFVLWECKCDCGNTKLVISSSLINGETTSCGCYINELRKSGMCNRKHGFVGTRLYRIWNDMKVRCLYPSSPSYSNYGKRGISVCKEWSESFNVFKEWALNNGYDDNLTIERIDNNKNYEPSNCTWVPFERQSYNRRTSHFVTINGEKKCLAEWCKIYGIKYATVMERLSLGWDDISALTKTTRKV